MELILNTFGTSLSRDANGFVIIHKDGKQRIPAEGINAIHLSKGAQITSDAVILAIENEIEVLFTDKGGKPIGRIWSPMDGLIHFLQENGLAVNSFSNIQYGKNIRIQLGLKKAEINIFYGKRGFTVVECPRTGTNKELNHLCSDLIRSHLNQLT